MGQQQDSRRVQRILQNAQNAPWQLTDDFEVIFINKSVNFQGISGLNPQDSLDISVISFDTPQLSSEVTPTLVAGAYRLHNTKFQPFTFTITFRDTKGMPLKKYFTEIWEKQQYSYFDDIKSEVRLIASGTEIFATDSCLISSISQSQFDNNNTAPAEFSVEFMSPKYGTDDKYLPGKSFNGMSSLKDLGGSFTFGGLDDLLGSDIGGYIQIGMGLVNKYGGLF